MPAGQYHIFADQGSTFKLFVEYQTSGSTAIDLANYSADLQVRRNTSNENILFPSHDPVAPAELPFSVIPPDPATPPVPVYDPVDPPPVTAPARVVPLK